MIKEGRNMVAAFYFAPDRRQQFCSCVHPTYQAWAITEFLTGTVVAAPASTKGRAQTAKSAPFLFPQICLPRTFLE
jgi:hypothetical protein